MKPKQFLLLGVFSSLVFWITTFVCGLRLPGYNHLTNMVSELGALGTPTQYWFSIGLVLSAVLNLFFVYGVYQLCKPKGLSLVPVLFLIFYSFLAGPGIIPMPLPLHGVIGLPFILIIVAPLAGLFFWKGQEMVLKLRFLGIISFAVMCLGFLIYFPNLLTPYFGLKQRFLYAGWSIWSMAVSYRLYLWNEDN